MSEETNNSALSPESSPTVMSGKKRARRLNSRPLYIGMVIAGILALTMGWVMVERSNRNKAEVAAPSVRSAAAQAKALTAGGDGGVIDPTAPTLPLLPEISQKPALPDTVQKAADLEKKQEETLPPPPPPEKEPAKPRFTEEIKVLRTKRFRQLEAAIDSPIGVQLQEMQSPVRDKSAELANFEQQIALLGRQDAETYAERLAAIKALTEGGSIGVDYSGRGDLSRMNQFSGQDRNWENPGRTEAPSTPYIIRTGSVIPATMITGINSELPGQIVGQVSQDVYDSPTGKHLLIPQGSKLIGEYSSLIQYGQSRLFAVWQRIVFPDGKALDLGAMPGSSGAGYAGFRDRVNNHYVRIFGSAIMMSAVLAGVEMTQDDDDSHGNKQRMADALSESLGQVLGGAMAEMLSKNMSIAPTIEIRPGYRLNVMLVKDLVFHGPYRGFDYVRHDGR